MHSSRRVLRAVAVLCAALGLPAILLLGTASSASAANGAGVSLSIDGVHWSDSLTGSVFPSTKTLVPGDVIEGRFYVRNDRDSPAYIRIGLSSLTVTEWDLAQALTMTMTGTTSNGASGSSASFAGSGIVCSDLLARDTPVPSGGILLVDSALRFRSGTEGTDAQGRLANLGFIIELSDIDLNATATRMCNGRVAIGPVAPVDPGSGNGNGGSGTQNGSGTGNGSGSGTGSTDGSGSGSRSGADGSGGLGDTGIGTASGIISFAGAAPQLAAPGNTMRLSEEYAILVLLAAALAGMLLRLMAQRRWERMATRLMEGSDDERET